MLKVLLNNKKNPAYTTVISRKSFYHKFRKNTLLFVSFSSNQCSLLNGCKKLPTNPRNVIDFNIAADNIEKVIANLNSNKAHVNDNLNISLIKICGDTICKPLKLHFKHALNNIAFSSELRKGNIVSCYKK